MSYYLIKRLVSAAIIVTVTEFAKLNAQLGGFIKATQLDPPISFHLAYD